MVGNQICNWKNWKYTSFWITIILVWSKLKKKLAKHSQRINLGSWLTLRQVHGLLKVFFFVVASNLLPSASTYLLQSFLREEQAGYILGGAGRRALFYTHPASLTRTFQGQVLLLQPKSSSCSASTLEQVLRSQQIKLNPSVSAIQKFIFTYKITRYLYSFENCFGY